MQQITLKVTYAIFGSIFAFLLILFAVQAQALSVVQSDSDLIDSRFSTTTFKSTDMQLLIENNYVSDVSVLKKLDSVLFELQRQNQILYLIYKK